MFERERPDTSQCMAVCSNGAVASTWDRVRPYEVSPSVALGLSVIGQLVFRGRRATGLTQRELAARCELNQSTISRLENGLLRTFSLRKLALIFGVLHDPMLGAPPPASRWW